MFVLLKHSKGWFKRKCSPKMRDRVSEVYINNAVVTTSNSYLAPVVKCNPYIAYNP